MDEELKAIVRKMIDNGEDESSIDYVISQYNSKKKSGGEPIQSNSKAQSSSPVYPNQSDFANQLQGIAPGFQSRENIVRFSDNPDNPIRNVPIKARHIPSMVTNKEEFVKGLQERVNTKKLTAFDTQLLNDNENSSSYTLNDEDKLNELIETIDPNIDRNRLSTYQGKAQVVNELKEKAKRLGQVESDYGKAVMAKESFENSTMSSNQDKRFAELQNISDKLGNDITEKDVVQPYAEAKIVRENGNLYDDAKIWLKAIFKNEFDAEAISKQKEFNSIKLKPEFAIGLNRLQYSEPAKFERVTKYLKDGTPLSESQVAEITSIGLDISENMLGKAYRSGEIDEDTFLQKNNDVRKNRVDNIQGNKETFRALVSQAISDKIDADKPSNLPAELQPLGAAANNLFGNAWNVSDAEIETIGKDYIKSIGLDPNSAEAKEVIKYLQEHEGALPLQNSIAKSGFLTRDLPKGLAIPIRGIANTIEGFGKDNSTKYAESQSQANVLVADERTTRIKKDPLLNSVASIFEGTGQFATQVGLAYLTSAGIGGIGNAIVGDIGLATTGGEIVGTAGKVGNALFKSKDALSTFITSYAQVYDSNLKTALNYTSDNNKAVAAAGILSGLEGATELFLSPLEIAQGIGKKLFDKKTLSSNILNIMSDAAIVDKKAAIVKAITKSVGETAKVIGSEIGEEEVVALADYATNAVLNPQSKSFNNRDLANEIGETALQTGLTMVVPALGAGVGAYKANSFSKGALMISGQQRQKMVDDLNKGLAENTITQDQYNEKVAIVNAAAVANERIPLNDKDEKLTPSQKADYIYSRVSENILNKKLERLLEDKSRDKENDPEVLQLKRKIAAQQDYRSDILQLKPMYFVNNEKVEKDEFDKILESGNLEDIDLTVQNDNATQEKLRQKKGVDLVEGDATLLEGTAKAEAKPAQENPQAEPIVTETTTTEVNDDGLLAGVEEETQIEEPAKAEPMQPESMSLQDRLKAAKEGILVEEEPNLIAKAKSLSNNVQGVYRDIFEDKTEQILFEAAIQANSSESEKSGAIKTFGSEIVDIAQKLYPNAKVGDKFGVENNSNQPTETNIVAQEAKPQTVEQLREAEQAEAQTKVGNTSNVGVEEGSGGVGGEGFKKAGEKARDTKDATRIGRWMLDNSQKGDVVRFQDGGYEVTEVNTKKDGTKELVLTPFEFNEDGSKDYNNTGIKIISEQSIKNGSNLFENAYTNSKGERVIEQSTYEPVEQSLKETRKAETTSSTELSNNSKAVVEQLKTQKLTTVPNLGMGAKEADGMYISTEKSNRYATENNPAKEVSINIENPKVTDYVENTELQLSKLGELINNKKIGINDISEEYRQEIGDYSKKELSKIKPADITKWHKETQGETVNEDLFSQTARTKAAKLITEQYKAEGYDSLYFPSSETQEGYVIVFDKNNVNNKTDNNEKDTNNKKNKPTVDEKSDGDTSEKTSKKTRTRVKGTRKANRKIKHPTFLKALDLEVTDPYDVVLQYFIGGGKINSSAIKEIFANGKKSINAESQSRIDLQSKIALNIARLSESLQNGQTDTMQEIHDDTVFREAIESVLIKFNTRMNMANDLLTRYKDKSEENYLLPQFESIEEQKQYEDFLKYGYNAVENESAVDEAVDYLEGMTDEQIEEMIRAEEEGNEAYFETLIKEEEEGKNKNIDGEINFSKPTEYDDFQEKGKTPATKESIQKAFPQAIVVQSQSELPKSIQDAIEEGDTIEGVELNGKVYLVADNLPTMERAAAVNKHELVGHKGVIAVLKEKLDAYAIKFFNDNVKGKEFAFKKIAKTYAPNIDFKDLSDNQKSRVAQEYFAKVAEKPSIAPTVYAKIKTAISSFLRKLGIDIKLNDNDVKVLLDRALNLLNKQGDTFVSSQKANIDENGNIILERLRQAEEQGRIRSGEANTLATIIPRANNGKSKDIYTKTIQEDANFSLKDKLAAAKASIEKTEIAITLSEKNKKIIDNAIDTIKKGKQTIEGVKALIDKLKVSDITKEKFRNYLDASFVEETKQDYKKFDAEQQKLYDKYEDKFLNEEMPYEEVLSRLDDFTNKQNSQENKDKVKAVKEVFESENKERKAKPKTENTKTQEAESELDKAVRNIKGSDKFGQYLSGETIERTNEEKALNPQEIELMELDLALESGLNIIEVAKREYGNRFVNKLLAYIEDNNKMKLQEKALILVSLENELLQQKRTNPLDAIYIQKQQDLVRAKSQDFLRQASLAINMGRLRSFALTGFDYSKVTKGFFSRHDNANRKVIEKAVQSTAEDIQREAEQRITNEDEIQKRIKEEAEKIVKAERAAQRATKKEKVHKAIDDFASKWAKKLTPKGNDNLDITTNGINAKTLFNNVAATMKAAYDAGDAISKVVEDAVDYISNKLGNTDWDIEAFKKEAKSTLYKTSDKKDLMKSKREYRMLETERNRQLALVEKLKAKLSRLESGLLDETDIKERLKDVPEIEDLKQQVKDAEKELNAKIAKEKSLLDNIEKLNAELERVKNRKAKEKNLSTKEKTELSDEEKSIVESIKAEQEKWNKEKENAVQASKDYKKLETERNRQIDRVTELQERLLLLQNGQKPTAKQNQIKVGTPEIEDLKSQVATETKRLNDLENQAIRIDALEKELDDLKQRIPTTKLPSLQRQYSQREQELKDLIKAEKQQIKSEIRDSKLFDVDNIQGDDKEAKLKNIKKKILQQIDDVKKEILKKQRANTKKNKKYSDKEIEQLQDNLKSLEGLRDKYLPLPADNFATQKSVDRAVSKLTNEIMDLNRQIKQGYKDIYDEKSSVESDTIDALKEQKEIRQSLLEAIDPTPKIFVENALLEAGFGKEITVTTKDKDGNKVKEKRNILDWTKLAGEAGSIDEISKNVGKALEKQGFTDEQLLRIQDGFIEEYIDLNASIIEKSQTALDAKNKKTTTLKQKSATKRLAEMYAYGLFGKNLDNYEVALAKTLGITSISEEGLEEVIALTRALKSIQQTKFQDKLVTEEQIAPALQVIDEKIRAILHRENVKVQEEDSFGKSAEKRFLRVAQVAKSITDMMQTAILMGLKTTIENPISGAMEAFINKLGYTIGKGIPKELAQQRRDLAKAVFQEMAFQKGYDYGQVASEFTTKGNLEMIVNKMSDNEITNFILSSAIGKVSLGAVDSFFKSRITQIKVIHNLAKVLKEDRVIEGVVQKGMTQDEAMKYIAKHLVGQSFTDAKKTAKEAIDFANEKAGKKVFNDSEQFVNRLATDIVRASLVQGGAITTDMVNAAFNSSYRAAGRGLGHVANNFVSTQVANFGGFLEKGINEAIKEHHYTKAALWTITSMINKVILSPFVGGGSNWIVLTLEKTGAGVVMGLGSKYYNKTDKLDLTTEEGVNQMENKLYQDMKATDKILRGVIGGLTSALVAGIVAGAMGTDEYKRWRQRNKWAAKYSDIVTPMVLMAMMSKGNKKEMTNNLKQVFNKNAAFDKGSNALVAAGELLTTGETDKAGKFVGSIVNAPLPWRAFRDIHQLYQGMMGEQPYEVSKSKEEGFINNAAKGGAIDWLKNDVLK